MALLVAALWLPFTGVSGFLSRQTTWPPPAERVALPSFPGDEARPPIEMVDVLDIEGGMIDGRLAFAGATDLDLAPDGRLVVADPLDGRVVMLSRTGQALGELGRRGQGPGEFPDDEPRHVAATATRVVAGTTRGALIVYRGSDGVPERTIEAPPGTRMMTLLSLRGESVVTLTQHRPVSGEQRFEVVTIVYLETGAQLEVVRTVIRPLATMRLRASGPASAPVAAIGAITRLRLAADGDYLAVADSLNYTIAAFDTAGTPRWVLEIPGLRQPILDSDRNSVLDRLTGMDERRNTSMASSLRWLEQHKPAIWGLEIDGTGRLFVFRTPSPTLDRILVDVYRPDGVFLGARTIERSPKMFGTLPPRTLSIVRSRASWRTLPCRPRGSA